MDQHISDAKLTLKLFKELSKEIKKQDLTNVFNLALTQKEN